MATPRKHWFKVADSIARDDLTNDELATMIRLLAMLNTQWARDGLDGEEAARISLRPVDLMACTGSESLVRARRIVGALKVKVGLTVDAVGKQTTIYWPKSLDFQDWDSRQQGKAGGKSGPRVAPSETQDARRKTKTQDRGGEAPKAPASRKPREVDFPGAMTTEDWTALGRKHEVDPQRLFELAEEWAGEKNRTYKPNGWKLAINRALRDRWSWTKSLFEAPSAERESAAQARQRRGREAAREALSLLDGGSAA